MGEELDHNENYISMQQMRFPDSVRVRVDCPEEARRVTIPFLILFTLVENAFKHALDLYNPLELTIRCRVEGEYCRISVEDNGGGFPAGVMEEFGATPDPDSMPAKDHLGLTNVRYTLQFIYKRGDLLSLSNTETGARAEILIPTEVKPDEAPDL